MILLNQNIEAFIVVAELASISAAARRLNLTQTAITQRIKTLERETAITLFTRSRSGMKLTTEGISLLRHCLEARKLEDQVSADLKKTGTDRETSITITGPASILGGRILPQIRHIYEKWPSCNLHFVIDSYANRLNRLKQGLVDLALLQNHEVGGDFDSKVLRPLSYYLVCSSAWKDRSLVDILRMERLFSYSETDSFGLDYLKQFDLIDKIGRSRLYANEDQVLQNLIVSGVGYGLLPFELLDPLVKSKKLMVLNDGKYISVEMALAWYPRKEMPDYLKEIIKAIR